MATELIPVEMKACENCPRTFVRPVQLLRDPETGEIRRAGPKYCMACWRLSKMEYQPRSDYAKSAFSRFFRKRPDVWEKARKMLTQ